jgi:hypothetical protein
VRLRLHQIPGFAFFFIRFMAQYRESVKEHDAGPMLAAGELLCEKRRPPMLKCSSQSVLLTCLRSSSLQSQIKSFTMKCSVAAVVAEGYRGFCWDNPGIFQKKIWRLQNFRNQL